MTQHVDTLIIGSGVAGLFAAVRAAQPGSVMVVTKSSSSESNTRYAQGGIAAALFDDDSPEAHVLDTLAAGAGLCNENAVRILCEEGPARVRELIEMGVDFDRNGNGLARGREAAHSAARIVHAGGDATGAEVQRGLEEAVRNAGVIIAENTFLVDFLTAGGSVLGGRFLGADGIAHDVHASAIILAGGGAGRVYQFTTNPAGATGDGVAAAFRAGAIIADAEMYQFHPTLLVGGNPFLISEAVRGEGAVLRNVDGERFVDELAPRDVVAQAIAREMAAQDGAPVMLDATALGRSFLSHRFPTIDAHCRANGMNWSRHPVPVTPAAHFWMGGIATDTWGRTSLRNLYAVGEVACNGVHGANRLASNSLLEGLVFADRAVRNLTGDRADACDLGQAHHLLEFPPSSAHTPTVSDPTASEIQQLAWNELGVVRNEHGLRIAAKQLDAWSSADRTVETAQEWEAHNLLTVARLITRSASLRKESRGAHFRSDFPATNDERPTHTLLQRTP